MPFPDPNVLNKYLDDYIAIRDPYWHSIPKRLVDNIKGSGKKFVSSLFTLTSVFQPAKPPLQKPEYQTDSMKRIDMCADLKNQFRSAKEMNDWITILYELGNKGRILVDKKKWYSPDPLCSYTLNAIRSHISYELTSDAELNKLYDEVILKLYERKTSIKKSIYSSQKKGLEIDKLEEEHNTILYHLSDLNDDKAIFDGVKLGLFANFLHPEKPSYAGATYNFHKPWCYQTNYFQKYQEDLQNGRLANISQGQEVEDVHAAISSLSLVNSEDATLAASATL